MVTASFNKYYLEKNMEKFKGMVVKPNWVW